MRRWGFRGMAVESTEQDWTRGHAAHLLARAGFGGSPSEIDAAHQAGATRTVDRLLDIQEDDDLFPSLESFSNKEEHIALFMSIRDSKDDPAANMMAKKQAREAEQKALFDLRAWWLQRMRYSTNPTREKMVLFWHGHFIGTLAGAQASGDEADFLRKTALDAQMSSDKVREVTAKFQVSKPFPKSQLGNGLELVARLIAGSMPTRVYYVSQGGYDTHSNQKGTHERLLKDLDGALSAFLAEMKSMGTLDRVVVMTFSEFGRRVAENAIGGTDHGAAAPLFVLGGNVRAGLHGSHPSLTQLERGDLIHTTDFRSVYATLLEDWLKAPSNKILQKQFSKLPLLG